MNSNKIWVDVWLKGKMWLILFFKAYTCMYHFKKSSTLFVLGVLLLFSFLLSLILNFSTKSLLLFRIYICLLFAKFSNLFCNINICLALLFLYFNVNAIKRLKTEYFCLYWLLTDHLLYNCNYIFILKKKYLRVLIRKNSEHEYVYNADGMSENVFILGWNWEYDGSWMDR